MEVRRAGGKELRRSGQEVWRWIADCCAVATGFEAVAIPCPSHVEQTCSRYPSLTFNSSLILSHSDNADAMAIDKATVPEYDDSLPNLQAACIMSNIYFIFSNALPRPHCPCSLCPRHRSLTNNPTLGPSQAATFADSLQPREHSPPGHADLTLSEKHVLPFPPPPSPSTFLFSQYHSSPIPLWKSPFSRSRRHSSCAADCLPACHLCSRDLNITVELSLILAVD